MPSAALKDPPGLTFTFKNIGPVKDAELELGDLTIIAGRKRAREQVRRSLPLLEDLRSVCEVERGARFD